MQLEAITGAVKALQPELVSFLEEIVNLDSPTEDKELTDRVGDILQQKAESLGMTCRRDKQSDFADNRVCRLESKGKSPRILMVGHFDTVYAAGTTAERPFRVHGGRATGCGVLDMKGGLAIGLFALQALREALGEVPLPVTFIFNSDEEIGSPASRKLIEREARRHDLALVLEPGRQGPAIAVARKGVAIFQLEITGREAHAGAEPENGINAIVEAAYKVLAINALNEETAGTTVTPGVIRGGTKPYVVPGRTTLSVDCRVTDAEEQARVTAGIEAAVRIAYVPGTRTRLSGGFHRPPMELSPAAAAYVEKMQAVAEEVGYPLATAETGGASDGNLTAAAGTPTLDGLGAHGARAHSDEEYIEVASLEGKCRVLAAFLARLAEAE
ncbi:M20 family metallopeptidase [Afifella pfennigii]|uniref:M20 family metallopeptidase n=1 Tax=Afifella pfennigii TaxID=209897 RepID=UPI000555AEE9|nr:M20 family metallopeptidase [Afifella pfennigii]